MEKGFSSVCVLRRKQRDKETILKNDCNLSDHNQLTGSRIAESNKFAMPASKSDAIPSAAGVSYF